MIVRLDSQTNAVAEPLLKADAPAVGLQNNFGALRLFFAALVLFSHCFPLVGGNNDAEPLYRVTSRQTTLGSVAVDGFFLISGFLIARSWLRSRSTTDFIRKRILRIYPGYLVALVFSIVIAAVSAGAAWPRYFRGLCHSSEQLLRAVTFLEFGGLDQRITFPTNPFPHFVNGSLWTLNPELRCYALVVGLGVFGLLTRRRLMASLIGATYVLFALHTIQHFGETTMQLSRFALFFLIGGYLSTDESRLPRLTWVGFIASLVLLTITAKVGLLFSLIFPFVFTYLVFGLAFGRRTPGAALFARYDLSYGIYLYAFPIQQLLVQLLELRSPGVLFACAMPITALAAFGSWRWIEAPMLAHKAS